MHFSLKQLFSMRKREISFLWGLISLTILFFLSFSPVFAPSYLSNAEAGFRVIEPQNPMIETPLIQKNSFLTSSSHYLPEDKITVLETISVIVTAYSSTIDQTDLDPFVTAAGTIVRDGVVATNILPFGTKIKIPELYGDKVFVVEDRMHWRKGYHIDIWFPSRDEALQFGIKTTDALILSN